MLLFVMNTSEGFDMLDAIGHPTHARAWLRAELEAGRRIVGMGHRIYRVRDPRAAALEHAISVLERPDGDADRLMLARAVEREAERQLTERHPERSLRAKRGVLYRRLAGRDRHSTDALCANVCGLTRRWMVRARR